MSSTSQLMNSLLSQTPLLIVYCVGIFLSIVFWSRAPRAAMLALIGSALLLATAVSYPLIQQSVLNTRAMSGRTTLSMPQVLTMLSLAFSFVRAGGYMLLIAAAFVGRPANQMLAAFPMATRASSPPPLSR